MLEKAGWESSSPSFIASSLTIHKIDKLETARRKKCSSTKLENLENDVKIFIELDKMTFIESTNNFTTIDAFKMLKCLGGRKSLPNRMTYLESSAMSDLEKANLFNIFFHSVYQKCSFPNSAPNEIESPDIQLSDLLVTPAQVGILLENLPPSTIAVADGIPPFVLKNCAVTLAPLVHLVFSNILILRKWPTIWKCSSITPIHKKESKIRVENYRPISILSRLSLILEKILFEFLYAKVNYKLSSRQHGFRKKHSTITQLLVFLDEIYVNYDKNVEQVIIYLDFAKAFDSLDHAILLKKLSLYGLDNDFLQLMFSYLTGRNQRVNINGILSDEITINSGVPQGSVLGAEFKLFLFCRWYQIVMCHLWLFYWLSERSQ